MNIANLLIEKLVTGEGDLDAVMPLESLFAGEDARALHWIVKHQLTHGKLPGIDLLEANFPPVSYKLNPANREATFDELIELGTGQVLEMKLGATIASVIDAHESGNINKAVATLQKFTDDITVRTADDRIKVLSLDELENLEEPETLIEGVLQLGTVAMLNGYRGSGKSFLAIDWACCIASGQKWMGHETYNGTVIYIAAEGGHGLKKRIKAWQNAYGSIPADKLKLIIQPVQLTSRSDVMFLHKTVREEDACLVVIDTQARCTVGLEENSAKDMGQVVDTLYKLKSACAESNTTILDVHHTGYQNGRARGSSALEAALDTVFTVDCAGPQTEPNPAEWMKLKNTKQKDLPQHAPMTLRLVTELDSCILEQTESSFAETQGPGRVQMLELLEKAQDGVTSPEAQEALNMKQTTAAKILRNLVAENVVAEDGKRGRAPVYRLTSTSTQNSATSNARTYQIN